MNQEKERKTSQAKENNAKLEKAITPGKDMIISVPYVLSLRGLFEWINDVVVPGINTLTKRLDAIESKTPTTKKEK